MNIFLSIIIIFPVKIVGNKKIKATTKRKHKRSITIQNVCISFELNIYGGMEIV